MATTNFYYKNTNYIFGIEDRNSEFITEEAIESFKKYGFKEVKEWEKENGYVIAEKTEFIDEIAGQE